MSIFTYEQSRRVVEYILKKTNFQGAALFAQYIGYGEILPIQSFVIKHPIPYKEIEELVMADRSDEVILETLLDLLVEELKPFSEKFTHCLLIDSPVAESARDIRTQEIICLFQASFLFTGERNEIRSEVPRITENGSLLCPGSVSCLPETDKG